MSHTDPRNLIFGVVQEQQAPSSREGVHSIRATDRIHFWQWRSGLRFYS